MVRFTWDLSEKVPAPPLYAQRHGPPIAPPPAKQVHGNVINWNQEPSVLELEEKKKEKLWRKVSFSLSQFYT